MKFKNKETNAIYTVVTPSLIEAFKSNSKYEVIAEKKGNKRKGSNEPKPEEEVELENKE